MNYKIKILFVICAIFLISFIENEKDQCTYIPSEQPQVSFKINNILYEAQPNGLMVALDFEKTLQIGGNTNLGMFVIGLYDIEDIGEYKIIDGSRNSVGITFNQDTYSQDHQNAILTVTISKIELSKFIYKISGTFFGILYNKKGDKIEITEGKFTSF